MPFKLLAKQTLIKILIVLWCILLLMMCLSYYTTWPWLNTCCFGVKLFLTPVVILIALKILELLGKGQILIKIIDHNTMCRGATALTNVYCVNKICSYCEGIGHKLWECMGPKFCCVSKDDRLVRKHCPCC